MDMKIGSVKEIEALLGRGEVDTELLIKLQADSRSSVRKAVERYFHRMQNLLKEHQRIQRLYDYERQFYNQGHYHVAGVDEVGRGPIAGPVTVGAVILPPQWECVGINDSKKLSPHKREQLFSEIMENAVAVSCVSLSEKEVDRLNIYQAAKRGMYNAIAGLSVHAEAVLIDAMPLRLDVPSQSIIKGDTLSASIAAAAIIAKVTRDRMMCEYDKIYPEYGFSQHKGYLTEQHREAIEKYGPCPIHRRSFEPVRSMMIDSFLRFE